MVIDQRRQTHPLHLLDQQRNVIDALRDDVGYLVHPQSLAQSGIYLQIWANRALFARAFETASQVNLDAMRWQGIHNNASDPPPANYPGLPQVDARSMSKQDMVEGSEELFGDDRLQNFPPQQESPSVPEDRLPYASLVREVHAPLADINVLIEFLRTQAELVRRLIRPPFGRVPELEVNPGPVPNPRHRDPRVVRDQLHDMRMPPYIRDSDNTAMSLSWRQYHELMDLIEFLSRSPTPGEAHPASLRRGPLARKITQLANRVRASVPTTSQPRGAGDAQPPQGDLSP
jgi:hypothetical protein